MRTRTTTPVITLLAAIVLVVAAFGAALAQDGSPAPSPSPSPSTVPAVEQQQSDRRLERRAARVERRVERAVMLAERKAARDIARAEHRAARDERRAEHRAARDQRQAARAETRVAWREAREACRAQLSTVRADDDLDRDARREAWREAITACRSAFAAITDSIGAGGPPDALYTEAAADASGVVRTDLGIAEPDSAPGQQLGLWHYLIPAGQELAPHTHPGWQLARVTAGELEYTVLEGEGVLLRADGSSEPMGPGTYQLAVGDGVIENPELVHLGANRTDEPVTIISATLFEAGQDIATVVEMPE